MSINKKSNRIDLDAGDILYHMKVSVPSAKDISDASSEERLTLSSLRQRAMTSSTFGWPSYKRIGPSRGTRPRRPALCCRRCLIAPLWDWLRGTEMWWLKTKNTPEATANTRKSFRVKILQWSAVSLCARTLHGCWNQPWHQEGCLQGTQQWIKKCLPGCSKATTQTTALKVVLSEKKILRKFLTHWSSKHLPCLLSELNRCHLDLSELNRLIQGLQALEVGQAFTNGDLKRIISTQVGFPWLKSLNKSSICSHQRCMTIMH